MALVGRESRAVATVGHTQAVLTEYPLSVGRKQAVLTEYALSVWYAEVLGFVAVLKKMPMFKPTLGLYLVLLETLARQGATVLYLPPAAVYQSTLYPV